MKIKPWFSCFPIFSGNLERVSSSNMNHKPYVVYLKISMNFT